MYIHVHVQCMSVGFMGSILVDLQLATKIRLLKKFPTIIMVHVCVYVQNSIECTTVSEMIP